MQELKFALKTINISQLDGEFRAAFDKRYFGLSTDQDSVRVHLDDDLTKEELDTAAAVYEAHTPTETDEQATERKRAARKTARTLLRQFKREEIRSLADALPYLEAVVKLMADD